jgi:hypothetical protein
VQVRLAITRQALGGERLVRRGRGPEVQGTRFLEDGGEVTLLRDRCAVDAQR